MVDGSTRLIAIRSVEFIDYEVGRPTHHTQIGLQVGDQVSVAEVQIGGEIRAPVG